MYMRNPINNLARAAEGGEVPCQRLQAILVDVVLEATHLRSILLLDAPHIRSMLVLSQNRQVVLDEEVG
jgi:hypothetical protein